MRVKDGVLHFSPYIPEHWESYSFRIDFRGRVINVKISKEKTETILESGEPIEIVLNGKKVKLS